MPYKLGKHPPEHDARTLKLASYSESGLPMPPPSIDWAKAVRYWPPMLNQCLGDCTVAAAGHMIQCWTANAGQREIVVSDATIKQFYRQLTGAGENWEDVGVSLLRTLKRWRRHGLDRHKITAFLSIAPNDRREAMRVVSIFGGCYIGLALPDFAAQGNKIRTPWTIERHRRPPPRNPSNGHCVVAVAYDTETLTTVTWGRVKRMTWEFYEAYSDEAFALLSPLWLRTKYKKAPSGLNLDQLQSDLREIERAKR